VCGLSASAGNLLILFPPFGKNQPMRLICRAGKWPEITVTSPFIMAKWLGLDLVEIVFYYQDKLDLHVDSINH